MTSKESRANTESLLTHSVLSGRSVDMASPYAAEANTASASSASRLWQVRRWWACKRAKKPTTAGASLARRRSFSLGAACSSGQESTAVPDCSESRLRHGADCSKCRRRPSD